MPRYKAEVHLKMDFYFEYEIEADSEEDAKDLVSGGVLYGDMRLDEDTYVADDCPRLKTKAIDTYKEVHTLDVQISEKFDCETCEDAKTIDCSRCHATGMGMVDGSSCVDCHGRGCTPCPECNEYVQMWHDACDKDD